MNSNGKPESGNAGTSLVLYKTLVKGPLKNQNISVLVI
jgi:hypothetical protein